MDTETIDMLAEEEEEALTRPSSWSAALSQLPGFPAEGAALVMPQPMGGAARAVTSALDEDLDEESIEEPIEDEQELA